MLKKSFLLLLLYSSVYFSGCSIFTTPELISSSAYDLGNENIVIGNINVFFKGFINVSGAGSPMLIRDSSEVLFEDDTNRFILLPEVLIQRKFTEIFTAPAVDDSPKVSGRLWRFEIDKRTSKARMVMEYEIRINSRTMTVRHDISHPCGPGGRKRAAALEKCVISSARRLAGEITDMQKNISKDKKK